MRKRLDPDVWATHQLTGRAYEICISRQTGEIVVLGIPDSEDEDSPDAHNCDAMGCGTDHVLLRVRKFQRSDTRTREPRKVSP